MHPNQQSNLLKIASQAAVQAGHFLAQSRQVSRRVDFESAHDIKIQADKQSQKIILKFLGRETGLPIIAEEKKFQGITKKLTWVVDPLDGTLNFARRIPISCVSIGLWQGSQPVLGVIYDFNRQELFSGIAGKAAWLNEQTICTSRVRSRSKAILFSGFPAEMDLSPENLTEMFEQMRTFRKLRWIGSAALSLAYVACGRGDAYLERGVQLWDFAAGVPIVLGAGGKCRFTSKNGVLNYDVWAFNRDLK